MKNIMAVLAIAGVAAGGPAFAAEGWTGLYLNGGVGAGTWSADTTTVNPATGVCVLCTVQTQGGKGWLGKVGIGYDYQFHDSMVAGALLDYDFSSLSGTIQDQGPFFAGNIKQQSALAAGARIGWLFNPDTLGYVNGGWSRASFSGTTMVNTGTGVSPGFVTPSFKPSGWFIGAGMETKFAPGWFLRGEYRYASYSGTTVPDSNGALTTTSITFKPTVQTGTIQVAYRF